MAKKNKDPAFLMYSSDFLIGTALMTNEQVGMYIRILLHQHQSGRLSREDIEVICGRYDNKVMGKFTQDENGLYYNERLEEESDKRRKYSESRRNNRIATKEELTVETCDESYVESYDVAVSTHMVNENKDVNDNINKDKDRHIIPPSIEMVKAYCISRKNGIDAEYFWNWYNTRGWKTGKDKMKDWHSAIFTWEKNNNKNKTKDEPTGINWFEVE